MKKRIKGHMNLRQAIIVLGGSDANGKMACVKMVSQFKNKQGDPDTKKAVLFLVMLEMYNIYDSCVWEFYDKVCKRDTQNAANIFYMFCISPDYISKTTMSYALKDEDSDLNLESLSELLAVHGQ